MPVGEDAPGTIESMTVDSAAEAIRGLLSGSYFLPHSAMSE